MSSSSSLSPHKSEDDKFLQDIMLSYSPHKSEGDNFLQDIVVFSGSSGASKSSSSCESESWHQKILCVGLCRTEIIQVCEKFPEECSDLECIDFRWERGGNASNTCTVLAQFNTQVEFLGTLSNQEPRLVNLINDMDDHHIHHEHCPIKPNTTCPTSSVVINSSNQSRTRWSYNPNLPELTVAEFKKIHLEDYSWIHFEGRNVDNVMAMMEIIHNHNVSVRKQKMFQVTNHYPIVISIELDKKIPGIFKLLPYADVVFIGENFMNSEEAKNMTKTLEYVCEIQQKPGVIIIYARDERGALGRAPNGEVTQCPAQKSRSIVDIYGTSDTFNAAMIYFLNQEIIGSRSSWPSRDLVSVDFETVSPLEFICPEILHQALVFACRASAAKMGFKGFTPLRDVYERLTIHREIKL